MQIMHSYPSIHANTVQNKVVGITEYLDSLQRGKVMTIGTKKKKKLPEAMPKSVQRLSKSLTPVFSPKLLWKSKGGANNISLTLLTLSCWKIQVLGSRFSNAVSHKIWLHVKSHETDLGINFTENHTGVFAFLINDRQKKKKELITYPPWLRYRFTVGDLALITRVYIFGG